MRLEVPEMLSALTELNPTLVSGRSEAVLSDLTTDSRRLKPGQLFVALSGERFDGHDFIDSVLAQGAGGVLARAGWSRGRTLPGEAVIVEVADTLMGLGFLARHWRLKHALKILAVSGSMGKSTVKEMAADILAVGRLTLRNEGNFNNLIGLPLTLFRIEAATEAAVVEMGINLKGEMQRLVDMARPQAGLLTNIAPVHLDGLGGLDGVVAEKTALWRGLGPEGVAVVNVDDPRLSRAASRFKGPKVTFGTRAKADVRLVTAQPRALNGLAGGLEVVLSVVGKTIWASIPAVGRFQGLNAAAACAGALTLGAEPAEMAAGLKRFRPLSHRMRLLKGVKGIKILDDAYNANPRAMTEALETLKNLCPPQNKAAAVLGQMAELGQESEAAHRALARAVARAGVEVLVALGPWAKLVVTEARAAGMDQVIEAADPAAAAAAVLETLSEGDWVLVKGSRVVGLEKAVACLTGESDEA